MVECDNNKKERTNVTFLFKSTYNIKNKHMEYNFNPDAEQTKVKLHYKTLQSGLNFYKRKDNKTKVKELEDEIVQMKNIYSYLK